MVVLFVHFGEIPHKIEYPIIVNCLFPKKTVALN